MEYGEVRLQKEVRAGGAGSAVQGQPALGAALGKGRKSWLKSHVEVVPRQGQNSAVAGGERGQELINPLPLQLWATTNQGLESDTPRGLTHPTSDETLRTAEHAPRFFPTAPGT